jgi:hypothetical protein
MRLKLSGMYVCAQACVTALTLIKSVFCPQCVYEFRTILRINIDHFCKQH